MKFFIDTANLEQIKKAKEYGLIDGVTTNPTLFSKESENWKTLAEKICREVDGPVSLEVVGVTAEDMIKEAHELVKIGPNVVVKIPMLMEGLKAVKALTEEGINTNVTLVFQPLQALMAAKAGATYVSPFVGRLDAIGQNCMQMLHEIVTIYGNYGFETEIIVASVRHPMHIVEAATMGADIATIPYNVLFDLAKHPLTDKGLETFLNDWKSVKQ